MKKYRCIVIDPPWPSGKPELWGRTRSEDRYDTMLIHEIVSLDIPKLIHPDGCHLWLWATQSKMAKNIDKKERCMFEVAPSIARAWGFHVKNIFTWCKPNPGIGRYFQVNTEVIIFGATHNMETIRDGVARPTWQVAPIGDHSAKPDEVYDTIRRMSPGPRIDIFARREREGFDLWGDQAPTAVEIEL